MDEHMDSANERLMAALVKIGTAPWNIPSKEKQG